MLPVTIWTWEWSFSPMRTWKTYTCSAMISERLNVIELVHVHQEIVLDIGKIIDLFSVTNRRFNFIWFLLVFNQYIIFALKLIFATISYIYFQENTSINLYSYWTYFNEALKHLRGQSKLTQFQQGIWIGVKVEWNSKVHLVFKFAPIIFCNISLWVPDLIFFFNCIVGNL